MGGDGGAVEAPATVSPGTSTQPSAGPPRSGGRVSGLPLAGAATARLAATIAAVARLAAAPRRNTARRATGRSPVFCAEPAKTRRAGVSWMPSAQRPQSGAEA